jgi:hypothetical protein
MMAAVLVTFGDPKVPSFDRRRHRLVWLIEIDANYSLENVQRQLIDQNRQRFGEHARVSCELGRVRSIKRLIAWADRKRRLNPISS